MKKTNSTNRNANNFREHVSYIIEDKCLGMHKFYNTYGKFIKTIALCRCKDEDISNEVVNQVLVKVWQNVNKLKEMTNPEGWLYVVAINCTKDILKRKTYLPLNENVLATKDELADFLSLDTYESIISSLDKIEQQIINYKIIRFYSYKEIAEIVNMPISTVSSIYYRAKTKVKVRLAETGY